MVTPTPGPLTPRLSVFMIRALEEKGATCGSVHSVFLVIHRLNASSSSLIRKFFVLFSVFIRDDHYCNDKFACLDGQRSPNEHNRIPCVAFGTRTVAYSSSSVSSRFTLLFMLIIIIISLSQQQEQQQQFTRSVSSSLL